MTGFARFGLWLPAMLLLLPAPAAHAQGAPGPAPSFRVLLHVSADDAVRAAATASLAQALRDVRDVEIVTRDGDFVLSLVIVPTTAGGYAASMAVLTVYTTPALESIAERLGVTAGARDRLIAQFTGAGALLDQRIVTAADLATLCDDAAGALDADVLARERRFRGAQ